MPLDGIFLNNLCKELNSAVGSRIDKIFQPSRDEFILSLRASGFSKKLLLSARPGSSRIHFTEAQYENPAVPPMLCMLMRKHLSGGKIVSIEQDGFERVVTINLLCTGEMGEKRCLKLITELIGNQSNIILVGEDGKIIDSVRRSDIENSVRLVQPGALYSPPERPEKLSIFDKNAFHTILNLKSPVTEGIMGTLQGISPLIAREFSAAVGDDKTLLYLDQHEIARLKETFDEVKKHAENGKPYIVLNKEMAPSDFSYMPIKQYVGPNRLKEAPSFCKLLDDFCAERDLLQRLKHNASDVYRAISNAYTRTEKKAFLRTKELERCQNREQLRIYGELIKANISLIPRGAELARVPNYYDENLAMINIPLNPALSPAANSAKYFKDYRKLCSADQTLRTLIEDCKNELIYLDTVKDALNRAKSISEILGIKEELIATGYIKKQNKKAVKQQKLPPLEYRSTDGYKILVGRNNIQNDELTLHTAEKTDIWFHTHNIPGSHVIVCAEGTTPPDSTLLEAAGLAAFHSKAQTSSNVPIDYTSVKNIKKPAGAKPGMVTYKTYNTVFVTPKQI